MSSAILPPPLPTASAPLLTPYADELELIRRRNLKTEGTIRTIGRCIMVLGIIPVVLLGISVLFSLISAMKGGTEQASEAIAIASANVALAIIPAAFATAGDRLRQLKPTSSLLGIVLSLLLCLLVFPFGLALGVAGLLTFSRKPAKEILSRDYARVIERTPGITNRGSRVIPVFFGILAIVYALFAMVGRSAAAM
jgi:hypothetical protein